MAVGITFLKLLITCGLIIAATAFCAEDRGRNRLTDDIIPTHYGIKLIPYIEKGYFYGESNITIRISCPSQNISLRSAELIVFGVQLETEYNNRIYRPRSYEYHFESQTIVFNFEDQFSQWPLKPGYYILRMKFVGAISQNKGFFKFSYLKVGRGKWLFGTQTTQVQRIFPCWHEIFTATFNISVKHDAEYMALSNMPVRNQEFENDRMLCTHFKKTPHMSVDRIGIVVTDLCYNIRQTSTVNMWSRCFDKVLESISFARRIAQDVMRYLEDEWTDLYKVPQVNYIIAPNFQGEISQVPGIIFYREEDVIYTQEDSVTREVVVMRSVMREIINQLIKNVVDPSYSSFKLLNEGLSIFFGTYILEKAIPDSRAMDLFVVEIQHEAFHFNTLAHTYPDFEGISDNKSDISITVSRHVKAPVLWRMLQNVLSDEVFSVGLSTHFKPQSLKSPNNLWESMQHSIRYYDRTSLNHEYTIEQLMDIWTKQTYCPVVHAIRDYKQNIVKIWSNLQDKEYWLPVTYTVESQSDFTKTWPNEGHRLTYLNGQITLSLPQSDQYNWLIVNIQQTGFYRVNYDSDNWQKIAQYLKFKNYTKIHVLNRAQIIDDAFHCAIQRHTTFDTFFDVANYLHRETDYIVWFPMFKVLQHISCLFPFPFNSKIKEKLELSLYTLEKHVQYRESPTDNYFTKLLRQEALRWACIIGSSECLKEATAYLRWHLDSPSENKVPTELKEWVFCKGLKKADDSIWKSMFAKYNYTDKISKYLVCSEDSDIIIRYLSYLKMTSRDSQANATDNNAEIMRQHKIRIENFLSILARHGKVQVLQHILHNFEEIKPKGVSTVAVLICIINNPESEHFIGLDTFVNNMIDRKQLDEKVRNSVNSKIALCALDRRVRITRQEDYSLFS